MTRCDCCDLPVESCGKAAEQRQRAEARVGHPSTVGGGAFPAQYPGTCGGCGEPFRPGDMINPGGSLGWVAECCA